MPQLYETRDSIHDIWGPRTPYKHEWPVRCDEHLIDTPEKWVQSACVLCSNGCGMDVGVKDGKIVGVRGRVSDRVNKGRLGPKGLHGWTSIDHPDRLQWPQIRRNGKLERTTWEEAMELIVQRTQEIRSRLTNHGIGFYTSGQLFLEEYYVLAMVGKAGLHTLHMDGNTRLCTATAAASMRESFGSDGQPGSYSDVDYTHCLFLVGHNVAHTQTVLWSRILDRLEGPDPPKVIVVDPRQSETAKRATVHLAPKVGTNLALLNGIQHLLFKNGWINTDYVGKHVIGLEELQKTVEKYHPEYVESITGVPTCQLEEAARIIGTTETLLSTALQGVYQSNQATASACQINNINLLRGLIGKPGSGILQMNGQPTAQNNRETGCDGEFPGFRNHQNEAHMQEIADYWNIPYIQMPHWTLPTHIENMLKYIEDGSIEMLWVSGTNPMVSLPHLPKVRRLLTRPGLFLVCQDIFPTETTAVADLVLPAAQWSEKTGCFTNADRTMHLAQKAVEPPGEARSDLEIFLDFARRMEFKDKEGNPLCPFTESEEVFEAWKRMSFDRPCDCSALSYAKLRGGSGITWPCTADYPMGRERLFDDGKFFTDEDYCESYGHDLETGAPLTKAQYTAMAPAGRAILKSAHFHPSLEEPDFEFPLRLATGRNVYQFHTRTKTGRNRRLRQAYSEPSVQVSSADARALHLSEGEMVEVISRRGRVHLPVAIGDIEDGHVFITFHFGDLDSDGRARAANELTIEQWDPISKQPMFKSGAVRIEKCVQKEGEEGIFAKEALTATKAKKEESSRRKGSRKDEGERKRRLELWLGATEEAVIKLMELYEHLVPRLVHDFEVQAGLQIMKRLTQDMLERLQPEVNKYYESRQYGRATAQRLVDAMFPTTEASDPYEALAALQSLKLFLTYIEDHLTALLPASQALWDTDLVAAVTDSLSNIQRQKAWIAQQIKVKSPQTLLVPMVLPEELHQPDSSLAGTLRC
ncbi:molybdopterin oxidoreductase family protein [Aspergillus saccharolyticus JOP 1030-1]|uniref:Nitrate reductase n=1 Tax=Aspergillus saccharolyticus JOP 1030-1 TaxID=1450539 RepID=A0A318Z1G7_9EURO|nr:nitrate reductase [Aspergillus saccharolyticus JOP 1030-1]PYH40214.1 nitrate reductase [Aspergillus saccharolyticus JOP 1030-1]